MLQEGLSNLLANEASIVALLGAPGVRADHVSGVFHIRIPEKATMPAIALSNVFTEGDQTHDFANDFHRSRIEISCYGAGRLDPRQAKSLSTAVRRFLEGWHGVMSEGTQVYSTFLVSEIDLDDPEPNFFRCALDFQFSYADVGT